VAKAELDQAKTRLDAAEAAQRVAELQTTRASIVAPFDGVISARNAERGEVASPGLPLLSVVQLDPIKVTLAVSDRDVVTLREGTEVEVRTDAQSQPLRGSILRINPVADVESRSFAVEVEVPNAERRLLPGMIARVTLDQPVATGALVIPQTFLVTRRADNGVFVVEDGVARWRTLGLGAVVHDQVVVTSGLSAGDEVVVVGQRALAEGDRVIVSRKGRCCDEGRVAFEDGSRP
jgi:RND family efflux transporter MFP subunit